MTKKKVMVVMGTRPEAIKLAPVILELRNSRSLKTSIVSTGQHREMLDQVNNVFGIEPDLDLEVFQAGQSLNSILSKVIDRVDEAITMEKPDALLVQGDTTSVAGAALAAFNRSVPVVHLEAGLRSGNLGDPFPEEANRLITGQVASLHLAPTAKSRQNLVEEKIHPSSVAVTGNTVIDALLYASRRPAEFSDTKVRNLLQSGVNFILATTHRRENLGQNMESIGIALAEIARRYPERAILLPLHKNPKVRDAVLPHVESLPNVICTEPLAYMEFCQVLKSSHLVLTDSGGVQEEAPALGKPVLVLRDTTERPEAIESGNAILVGTKTDTIIGTTAELIDSQEKYERMSQARNPYGDGRASQRVVAAVSHLLGVGDRLPDFSYERLSNVS